MNQLELNNAILENKEVISKLQSSIIKAVAGLMYSEFIRSMKHKTVPVDIIVCPTIKHLRSNINEVCSWMESSLIERWNSHPALGFVYDKIRESKFVNSKEFPLVLHRYIIPNVIRTIPMVIDTKLQVSDNDNSHIRESRDIEMFTTIGDERYEYLMESIFLQTMMSSEDLRECIRYDISDKEFSFTADLFLEINHPNSISELLLNHRIFKIESIMELMTFITSIDFNVDIYPYELSHSNENEIKGYILRGVKDE